MAFKVGDVVYLKEPDRWVQPLRKWGLEGRQAEVIGISPAGVKVRFICARKPRWPSDYERFFNERDLRSTPPTDQDA